MKPAQKFIEMHNTMTLATIGKDRPSAAAVFYAPIKKGKSLLFVSSEKSEHIINSKKNNSCAVTIQEDGLEWNVIRGLQIKGNIVLANEKYWNDYFERYDYIKSDSTLSKALEKVKLYELKIEWIRMIDNSKGFGNREEYEV